MTPLDPLPRDSQDFQNALAPRYGLERELGRGGMGVVYLARDNRLDRPVAIKVLPPHLASQPDTRERFLREATTAAQLSHPNIVPIFGADEVEGHPYFIMAFVDGESLAGRVADRGPLGAAEAVGYLKEVAWALAYAHARGVVHRDVKPENIMIERGTHRAVVTDFGIARAERLSPLTEDGLVLGTVAYMSPEQVNGDRLDGRSDLYSLGVVGYYLLSGRTPFTGSAPSAILVAHAMKPAPPLRSVAPSVPAAIAEVIDRCLVKEPGARYDDGEALAVALAKALAKSESELATTTDGPGETLSEAQAQALWRRAAQLQAEAALRLERSHARAALASGEAATQTEAFKLRDVEASAVEAGISRQFVALALAELPSLATAPPPPEPAAWRERATDGLLGSTERGLSASRIIRHPPRRVLQALGRTLQAHPFQLTLRETVGGHPLDGGVMVFDVPPQSMSETSNSVWLRTRHGMHVKQLRVTLRALPSDPGACEIVMHADLRKGVSANAIASAVTTAAMGIGGGLLGLTTALQSAWVGAAFGLSVGTGIVALGAVSAVGYRALYRWTIRKVDEELGRALTAIEGALRSEALFGDTPRAGVSRALEAGLPTGSQRAIAHSTEID